MLLKWILVIAALITASTAHGQTDLLSVLSVRTTKCHQLSHQVEADVKKLPAAELACKSALDLAKKLPDSKVVEKLNAYGDYGWTLLRDERFSEAFEIFAEEAKLADLVKPPQPKLIADSSFDLARAAQGVRKTSEAKGMYLRAEKIYRDLYVSAKSESEKADLKEMIRRVLLLRKFIATFEEDGPTFKEVTKELTDLDKQP